jgi:hypothetical protein
MFTASRYRELTECVGLCNIPSESAKLFHYNNLSYFGVMIVPDSDVCHHSGTSELSVGYFIGTQLT